MGFDFRVLLLGFFLSTLTLSLPIQASQPSPETRQQNLVDSLSNPHPAQSAEDKNRVAFAEKVVKTLLQVSPSAHPEKNDLTAFDSQGYNFNMDSTCLSSPQCLNQNSELQKYIKTIFQNFGSVQEFRHAHIIPWAFEKFKGTHSNEHHKQHDMSSVSKIEIEDSKNETMVKPNLKNDEYIIHIYTKFNNNTWYHLDVIVSENPEGKLFFRRFFFVEIPLNPTTLPEGVVC